MEYGAVKRREAVIALAAFAIGVAGTSAIWTGTHHTHPVQKPAGCWAPYAQGTVPTKRIQSGVTVVGTDGRNGLAKGDLYTCVNGQVWVH